MAYITDYASEADIKSAMTIENTSSDAEIAIAITAASRVIDSHCGRSFGLADPAVARYYSGRWDKDLCRYVVDVNDLMTTTSLVVKTDSANDGTFATTLTLNTDYRLAPYNAGADGKPWRAIVASQGVVLPCDERGVEVTAKFGWTTVPTIVKQACLIQAARFLVRKDSPYGVAGAPDDGSEMRLLARLDPDVAVLLQPVTRYWGAV